MDDVLHDLLEDLREIGVEGMLGTTEAPKHIRGTELVEAAFVVVQGIVESGLARIVADRVQGWFSRSEVNQVEITVGESRLLLANATAEQQERLVEHFIKAAELKR
ncbi:hypothetical protein [Lentzea guizhouensis]|uniref:hypothetical protein n=1 Tax=Lentzea guizhouensis TaxID=1586287 RepID=UPI0012B69BCF|nr:hypothetical protein [Lentzea guizhouensis]